MKGADFLGKEKHGDEADDVGQALLQCGGKTDGHAGGREEARAECDQRLAKQHLVRTRQNSRLAVHEGTGGNQDQCEQMDGGLTTGLQ